MREHPPPGRGPRHPAPRVDGLAALGPEEPVRACRRHVRQVLRGRRGSHRDRRTNPDRPCLVPPGKGRRPSPRPVLPPRDPGPGRRARRGRRRRARLRRAARTRAVSTLSSGGGRGLHRLHEAAHLRRVPRRVRPSLPRRPRTTARRCATGARTDGPVLRGRHAGWCTGHDSLAGSSSHACCRPYAVAVSPNRVSSGDPRSFHQR